MRWVSLALLVGCGSSAAKQPDAQVDAPNDAAADAPVIADDRYIIDWTFIPTGQSNYLSYAFDVDGDGTLDNRVGALDTALIADGVDPGGAQIEAISRGDVLMLADLDPANAAFAMFVGTDPNPAPCNGSNDSQCRHHLQGTGTFGVALVPRNAPLAGSLTSNVYTGGPGHLSMQLSVGGGIPMELTLIAAHAQLTLAADTITQGKIGGAISIDDVQNKILPAIGTYLSSLVTRDCSMPMSPPDCGCFLGSQGAQAISSLDTNHDCTVTLDEIQNDSRLQPLLQPDVMVEGQMAMSCGFGVHAVKATFTP